MRGKYLPRNRSRTERRKMSRLLLTINNRDINSLEQRDQTCECDLGCIGLVREHRFTKEHPPERDPVEASQQLAVAPSFNRMRETRFVQFAVGIDDGRRDPRP